MTTTHQCLLPSNLTNLKNFLTIVSNFYSFLEYSLCTCWFHPSTIRNSHSVSRDISLGFKTYWSHLLLLLQINQSFVKINLWNPKPNLKLQKTLMKLSGKPFMSNSAHATLEIFPLPDSFFFRSPSQFQTEILSSPHCISILDAVSTFTKTSQYQSFFPSLRLSRPVRSARELL